MSIQILPIPALRDNYIWALVHPTKPYCAIVDPGDAEPALSFLQTHQLTLSAILITHHHWDHTQGISEIIQQHPAPVFGPKLETIPDCQHPVSEPDVVTLDKLEARFHVLDIPGHTRGHICYYGMNSLFCGDTLFTGGCGRAFEGSPKQLYQSLEKLAALPEDTQVYCGHEYTQKNLEFALSIEPDNPQLKKRLRLVDEQRAQNVPTVPSTLQIEKATNPFLRCHLPSIRQKAEIIAQEPLVEPSDVFKVIRALKDKY